MKDFINGKINTINIYKLFKIKTFNRDSTNLMIFLLSISNLIGNALNITGGFFIAKWLMPEDLGEFSSFTIITGYILLVQLGVPSGLGRELPFYIGQGKKEHAIKLAATAQFWQKGFALITLFIAIVISIYFLFNGDVKFAAGILVVGVTTWQGLYISKYLKVLYRTNRDFNKLSKINLIVALTTFISIIFVYYYSFYGLCIRVILGAIVDFLFTYSWRPLKVSPKWDKLYIIDLFKVGLPMYAVASIIGLWPLLQRTLVVFLGGPKALGLFTLATLTEGSMKSVNNSLSNVIYPTMSKEWGKGGDLSKIVKLALKPFLTTFIVLVLLIPFGWWLIPIIVEEILPKYIEGIIAAQWMLIVGCLGVFNVYGNVYNVVKDQKNRLVSYICAVLFWLLTVWILYKLNGFDLSIFPKAMVIGYLVMIFFNMFYIKKNWKISNNSL